MTGAERPPAPPGPAGQPRRVAGIDCGTNSIRLLVADVLATAAGPVAVDVHRDMRVVRLGAGVDATGRLDPAAIDRTREALTDYTAILRAAGATRVRMAATSASRDASNRQDFVAMVHEVLGQDPEVITGEAEAELSLRGAVGDLLPDRGPFLVTDIGGGSTELVVGAHDDDGELQVRGRVSLDIGCVRMTERVLVDDPPGPDQVRQAESWAADVLGDALDGLPLAGVRRFVAVSGTATTVAAAALGLAAYDPRRIHLARVAFTDLHRAAQALLHAARADRAAMPFMHPGRVDVIGSGALVLDTLADLVASRTGIDEVTVSEHDILDGLALSLA